MRTIYRSALVVLAVVVMALTLGVQSANAQARTHVVRRGENLSSIAARYGTTVQAIVTANGLANPSLIYAGQRLAIPGSTGSPASAGASGATYTVRRGDTLSSIAHRHGTTVNALVRANGLANPSYIYPGQRLVISGGASSGSAGQASSGGSQAAGGGGVTHTVRRGDTVSSIALRYGTTVTAIVQANGLANPRLIYAGQRLRIPGGGGAAAPAAPSGAKRIVVDLSEQRMYVYQGGQLVWKWAISTGQAGMGTAVGHYKVQNKIPNAYASTWNLQMPYWLGIYWAGSLQNGIHALPIMANGQLLWAGYLGSPASYGCVILGTKNARTLYNWASVGTPVDVVW